MLSKDICWRGLRDHNKIILSPVLLLGKLLFHCGLDAIPVS
jgi:hypothetical protein